MMNGTNMSIDTVGHQLRLSIRRNEGDSPVALETRESDALMELHILHHHRLPFVP